MTSLFDSLPQDVVEILAEVGRSAIVTIEGDAGQYDPGEGVVADVNETTATVTISPLLDHRRGMDQAGVRTGTGRFIVAALDLTHVPKSGEKWTIDSETWTVLEVKRIAIQSTTVAYSMTVEKGGR